ncbi:hypothetical protein [Bacillus salipaludis]|uniref:Uncharacterized protein n=1 Tax=Bacillus salipaludis TaxID=2547811 RepID=A0AA90QPS5_9BACI|nr:hypothetical protein [Bacillus salipaludis]MDQ6595952.1 hypothetical protein [Bacillus salipaludis]
MKDEIVEEMVKTSFIRGMKDEIVGEKVKTVLHKRDEGRNC